jgi:hypothetical protein
MIWWDSILKWLGLGVVLGYSENGVDHIQQDCREIFCTHMHSACKYKYKGKKKKERKRTRALRF